jgi:hypothetical protein
VTNSGTSSAAVFDFVLQQGAAGTNGATGDTGPQGPAGIASATAPVTVTGPTGAQTIAITDASNTLSGAVTTGTQTFAGAKTFNGVITANGGIAGAAAKSMAVASAYSGSTFASLAPRVIMTASQTGAADPTTRPDGTALVAGDIWIDW